MEPCPHTVVIVRPDDLQVCERCRAVLFPNDVHAALKAALDRLYLKPPN